MTSPGRKTNRIFEPTDQLNVCKYGLLGPTASAQQTQDHLFALLFYPFTWKFNMLLHLPVRLSMRSAAAIVVAKKCADRNGTGLGIRFRLFKRTAKLPLTKNGIDELGRRYFECDKITRKGFLKQMFGQQENILPRVILH